MTEHFYLFFIYFTTCSEGNFKTRLLVDLYCVQFVPPLLAFIQQTKLLQELVKMKTQLLFVITLLNGKGQKEYIQMCQRVVLTHTHTHSHAHTHIFKLN